MAGWSKPDPITQGYARAEAKAFGHRMVGRWQRIGLSSELKCADCTAYVILPNAYARMGWESQTFDGPAVQDFCSKKA